MKISFLSILALLTTMSVSQASPNKVAQGVYFSKKAYEPTALPRFEELKQLLPQPIYEQNELWCDTYWKAWEIAFGNFYAPTADNGFVSSYIDAAFNNCIFLWDTSFMTMFCNYAHPLIPGIASLDNFYAKQHLSGEICREISRVDGTDCPLWVNHNREPLYSAWGYKIPERTKTPITYIDRKAPVSPPVHTLDNFNHPIMAWAELESYKVTGDSERLRMVYHPLRAQYQAFKRHILQGNGLYMTDWASMDNSSRNQYLIGGGTGIDISCEMALFADNLVTIASLTGNKKDIAEYRADYKELSAKINSLMWDDQKEFYFDLTLDGKMVGMKTVAAYWSLISGVADRTQSDVLVSHLTNPQSFGCKNMVPTLAANEQGFSDVGDYWCGSVWAPTTTMVIAGLERYGYRSLATKIALNHIDLVSKVCKTTGTIWENYAPNRESEGYHADGRPVAKDFVGWSGIAPIKLLIEYAIGLKPDAQSNTIEWTIASDKKLGCRNFRFNGNVVSLETEMCNSNIISVEAEQPFTLIVVRGETIQKFAVKKGVQQLALM